jgi:hypothetical protein
VHTQNGLADGHEDVGNMHQPSSLCLGARSIAYSYAYSSEAHRHPIFSMQQLVIEYESSISYLRIFGCAVYVSIMSPHRINVGPQ